MRDWRGTPAVLCLLQRDIAIADDRLRIKGRRDTGINMLKGSLTVDTLRIEMHPIVERAGINAAVFPVAGYG